MSYGQNQPWGLQAIKTIGAATWNGQTSQYLIQSGYAFNIFKGDLVYLGADGYIHNLSDLQVANYPTAQALGVFNGCSFATPTSINPIDPASPGRSFWPGGTVTLGGVDATCDIIDDPNTIYNIQSSGGVANIPQTIVPGSIPFNGQGQTASVAYNYTTTGGVVSDRNANGNFQTGTSFVTINSNGLNAAANQNLRILRFVPTPPNNGPGQAFNNVEVIIQNHSFVTRPVGL